MSGAFAGCGKIQPFALPDTLLYFSIDTIDYSTTAPYACMFNVEKVSEDVQICYLKQDINNTNDHFIALGYMTPTTAGEYEVDLVLNENTTIMACYFNAACVDWNSGSTAESYITTKSVDFGKSLKCIGDGAFALYDYQSNSTYLDNEIETLIFPSTLKQIGDKAFCNYSKSRLLSHWSYLETVKFNEGLEYIGNQAFTYQDKITKLEFPSTLLQIGYIDGQSKDDKSGAFQDCYGVESISFADNSQLKYIGDYTFCDLKKSNEYYVTKKCDLRIPDSVEAIGPYAFYNTFIPTNGFKVPSNCKYLYRFSLWLYNADIHNTQYKIEQIDITVPKSVVYMECPFGSEWETAAETSFSITKQSGLTFEDKNSVWDVDYNSKDHPYPAEITLTSDGKISPDDYVKFMSGNYWPTQETAYHYHPCMFDWTKKTN